MDSNPRVLLFNCSELGRWTGLLEAAGAPAPMIIEPEFGEAYVYELLFETAQPGARHESAESVLLFFNVESEVVKALMQAARPEPGLERPIYAMVTENSIEWRFCDLLEHLIEEREHFRRREAELAGRG